MNFDELTALRDALRKSVDMDYNRLCFFLPEFFMLQFSVFRVHEEIERHQREIS